MSCMPLATVTPCVVSRREALNTLPRPPHLARTQRTEAANDGGRVFCIARTTQESVIERTPSSNGPRRIAVTEPSVQRMDRSCDRMAWTLPWMNVQPKITGIGRSLTTRKGTGTIRAPVWSLSGMV